MMRLCLVVGWLFAAGAACAQERAEFKSVPLGTPLNEFREKNPLFQCGTSSRTCSLYGMNRQMQCTLLHSEQKRLGRSLTSDCLIAVSEAGTYATRPANLSVSFIDGALSMGHATILPQNFSGIVDAITARYGKPSSMENETLQNRMGATFQNETITWTVGADQVVARKYGADLTRGSVIVIGPEERARIRLELERKRKAAPADL